MTNQEKQTEHLNLASEPDVLLKLIKGNSDIRVKIDAAAGLLKSLERGRKFSDEFYEEISDSYRKESNLELCTALKRVINKINLISSVGRDPLHNYDRKLKPEEIKRLEDEIKKFREFYDEVKGRKGEFDKRYKSLGPVEEGGVGEVFRALRLEDNKIVAIKYLLEKHNNRDDIIQRFKREAEILIRLKNDYIVRGYEYGEANNRYFFVMEYVEGRSLESKVLNDELSFEEIVSIFYQVLEGLEVVHREGVIHRDIKPENIMILPDGKIKIIDFNLSRDITRSRITAIGIHMGTKYFESPEQVEGCEDIDVRSDIYNLGVSIYYCFTGGKYPVGSYDMASAVNRDVPEEFDKLIEKCIKYDRAERWHSVGEIKSKLKEFII